MEGVLLVGSFATLIAIGVPISFTLGIISFLGLSLIPNIPEIIVFTKMFNGLNSFVLLAVPLFILAANLMNRGDISRKLIDFCTALVGHIRGGLAHSNILVSMIFAGVSGSSQADTAGVGKILIPSMERHGYDKETAVGITAASSTIGSIIPPSIVMVIYSGIANVSVGGLFLSGMIPGILIGLVMMGIAYLVAVKRNFPKYPKSEVSEIWTLFKSSFPALLTPLIIIGGIITGLYTATEAAAFACVYALFIGMVVYKTIKVKHIPEILLETLKLSALSLFALATANALGELLGYYHISDLISTFFLGLAGGKTTFMIIVIAFFLFIGTFMDGVPAMILFVPVILPSALAVGIDPIHLGLVITMTLSLGLVTPPYGLCLLIAGSISNLSIEKSFKGVMPYLCAIFVVIVAVAFLPDIFMGIPKLLNPQLFL
jgi:tripartite ATP-independent transporter DctM subunit